MVSPMERDDHVLPLTRGQLDIWLAHESGHSGTEWQLGLLVRIEGTVKRDLLERAIRQALQEAEPARAAFFEVDGQVFQKAIDYSDVELAFHDLSGSDNPVQEAREIASSIQRTPMPFTGPLFKFALFQTQSDEFYLFGCCHHMAVDGLGIALCGAVGLPLSTLQLFLENLSRRPTSARCRTWWIANRTMKRPPIIWKIKPIGARTFHRKADRIIGCPKPPADATRTRLLRRFNWTRPSSAKSRSYHQDLRMPSIRRSSPRRAHYWCVGGRADGSEVVLDFPVSRRVRPETKTLPGMFAGVVPLVLKASPESTVADFCQHVDSRIREALQHQRFPVHALEGDGGLRGPRQASNRVAVNFIPGRLTLDLAGAPGNGHLHQSRPCGSLWAVLPRSQ